MASDGRRRARDTRGDARSRERARATRRRSQQGLTRRASPAPASGTGRRDTDTNRDDRILDTVAGLDDADLDDLDDTGVDEPDVDVVDDDDAAVAAPVRSHRDGSRRSASAPRFSGVLARLQNVDARRAVVMAVVVSVVAMTLAVPLRTYFEQRTELHDLVASNQEKRQQLTEMQQKVNEQNDPAYIETWARTRLQFVKPGETPLVMMFPGDAAREAAQQEAEKRAHTPWYGNLWDTLSTPPGVQ